MGLGASIQQRSYQRRRRCYTSGGAELGLSEGEPAWQRLLERLPMLKAQFKQAVACQPFRHYAGFEFS